MRFYLIFQLCASFACELCNSASLFTSDDESDHDESAWLMMNSPFARKRRSDGNSGIVSFPADVIEALSSSLNKSVDPCDDFYSFVCGNWIDKNAVPEDQSSYSMSGKTAQVVAQRFAELFGSQLPEGQPRAVQQAKLFYDVCMDEAKVEEVGSRPLRADLESLGGWPLMIGSKWDSSKFDLTRALIKMSTNGLFISSVKEDVLGQTFIPYLVQRKVFPSFHYLRTSDVSRKAIEVYKNLTRKIVTILNGDSGTSRPEEDIEAEIKEQVEFEKKLAKVHVAISASYHEQSYERKTIADLDKLIPKVNWAQYYQAFVPTDFVISSSFFVGVKTYKYFEELGKILKETSNDRALANFLFTCYVLDNKQFLDKRIIGVLEEASAAMGSVAKNRPRVRICFDAVNSALNFAAAAPYVKKYFPENLKSELQGLVIRTKAAFQKLIQQSRWMGQTEKEKANLKIDKTVVHLGYPDFIKDDTKLNQYYEGLKLESSDLLYDMKIKADHWLLEKLRSKLGKTPNRETDYDETQLVLVANAHYYPEQNSAILNSAVLQPPMFYSDAPRYFIYGMLGIFFGHELSHGLDADGRQYDENGHLNPWWGETTNREYNNRTQCFINLFNSSPEPRKSLTHNGELVKGEAVADHSGIRIMYNAYKTYLAEAVNREAGFGKLEDYNAEKLFFISVVYPFCTRFTDYGVTRAMRDQHPIDTIRWNLALANLEEFSKTFQCEKGTKMNREEKCGIFEAEHI